MKPTKALFISLFFCCCISLWNSGCQFLRGYAEGTSDTMPEYEANQYVGFYRLMFEDFQGLNTDTMRKSAIPWKPVGAALLLFHNYPYKSRAGFNKLLSERYGFVNPSSILNNPDSTPVSFRYPMGIVAGTVERALPTVRLEVANTGCSTCHSTSLRGEYGQPTTQVWIGAPSSDINFERYASELYEALAWATAHEDEVMAAIPQIFPETSDDELKSIKNYVFPPLRKRLQELDAIKRFTPYSNGGAGITNGAATLQFYFGWYDVSAFHSELAGYTAAPSFGGLKHKISILCDGIYAAPGAPHEGPVQSVESNEQRDALAAITSIFTIGTLGVDVELAADNKNKVREAIDYLVDHHRTPPFPGKIDAAKAAAGRALFDGRCAGCHGVYEPDASGSLPWILISYPGKRSPADDIGSDRVRVDLVSERVVQGIQELPIRELATAKSTGGYMAIPLTGLWATAPYLHNNSVPTIWHLLHPEARPSRFEVGGHPLDYAKLGIRGELDSEGVYRLPKEYKPWTIPELYDTQSLGRGNQGHEAQFDGLTDEEKEQLIEHLKRL